MPKSGEPRTSVRRLRAAEKQKRALEMRIEGAAYEEIRAELGYRSRSGAHKAVMSALRKMLREPADTVRELELQRLDRILRPMMQLAITGDAAAVDRVLKVMDRRAKLLGLDAPTKSALTDPEGNALPASEWTELRTTILRVLEAFPDARAALVGALEGNGHDGDSA